MPDSEHSRHLPVRNGLAQEVVRRTLRETLPQMRAWDEGTDGRALLEDVTHWLLKTGMQDERRRFRKMFPAVCVGEDWNLCISALDVDLVPHVMLSLE